METEVAEVVVDMTANAMMIGNVMGPVLLVFGLSMLFYGKQWMQIMSKWQKDHSILIPQMFMELILGLLIVGMYNDWTWNMWIIVTIVGWGMILESVAYFLLPASMLKSMFDMRGKMGLVYFVALLTTAAGAVLTHTLYLA
ncbi:hypothetical protein JKY72_00760 [Candidatus Gracilibacteria bacterium]|nr:hypothetical protein [Candidatus Gracilibacteria bacterium]